MPDSGLIDTRVLLYRKPFARPLFSPSCQNTPHLTTTTNIGRVDMAPIDILIRCTLSHILVKFGTTCAGNIYGCIYPDMGNTPAAGALLAVTANLAKSGTSRIQKLPLTANLRVNPGRYWIGLESDEATTVVYYGIGTYLAAAIDPLISRAYYDRGPYGVPSAPCPAVTIDQYSRWMGLEVVSVP